MATLWVSTAGTDTASGTNYSVAKKTFSGAYSAVSQGDTVNMVADGEHEGSAVITKIAFGMVGTDFDTDPGLHVRGCDTLGASAMCTVAFTATKKLWTEINNLADYVWIEGMRFDYTALRGIAASSMNSIGVDAQVQNARINDCECFLTTNIGSTVDLTTNIGLPSFPFLDGASVSHVGELEFYNNVLINARVHIGNYIDGKTNYHHNIIAIGGIDLPSTVVPIQTSSGSITDPRRIHHNTLIHSAYGSERLEQDTINLGGDDTTNLSLHSNLLFAETGTGVSDVSTFRIGGNLVAAQTTSTVTISNNYIAIGPNLEAEASGTADWNNSTTVGIHSYQANPTWRGGGTNDGTALNSGDVFNRTGSLTTVFSDFTASYTWTPGDYDHNLPFDLRPLVGRTDALAGDVVGAISDSINADPIVIPSTHTATSGVLKTVNSTNGVLAGSSDPDGDTLTATIVSPASNGIVVLNTTDGSFDYTPIITLTGTDTFTFKAWDGTTYSNVSTGTINVSNTTPTAQDFEYETTENSELAVAAPGLLEGSDANDVGQTVTITNVGTPSNGILNIMDLNTGEFEYEPNSFFSGGDQFTFFVTDGNTQSAVHTVTIRVVGASAPISSNPEYLDTYPFFRPALHVATEFRMRSKQNRRQHLDFSNYTEDKVWNESTHRVLELSAAATTTITLGGVSTAQYLLVETDYPIEVSIDGTDKYWPVSKCAAIAMASYSSIALKSVATTTAQVILTVVD